MLTDDIVCTIETAIDALIEGKYGLYASTIQRLSEDAGERKCNRYLLECLKRRTHIVGDPGLAKLLEQEVVKVQA